MTETSGDIPGQPEFSQAAEYADLGDQKGPDNRAELNAELGFEAVLESAQPYFQELLGQLRDPLKNGDYSSILGEDVTGRIPALVVGGVADRIAEGNGDRKVKRRFFSGGSAGYSTISQAVKLAIDLEEGEPRLTEGRRKIELATREQRDGLRDQMLADYLESISDDLGDRMLLVTDHIWTGRTVDRVGEMLHERGVKFDIATLGTNGDMQDFIDARADRNEFKDVRWFSGGDTTEQGVLYSRDDVLEGDENPVRQAIGTEKNWLEPVAKRSPQFDGAQVRAAREYLNRYTSSLYEGIDGQKTLDI